MPLTLATARLIADATLAEGGRLGLHPLAVVVVDAGGAQIAALRQDGASPLRPDVALGKACGAALMGLGSRALAARAERNPAFAGALTQLAGGRLVPVPGGVLIRENGAVIGAVGVSGDASEQDEAAAMAGIAAAGLVADPG
jgi:uncharacterized protein GlcG (DUF336 family)